MKWFQRLIPRHWRDSVVRDLEDEAGARRPLSWTIWHLGVIAARLRIAMFGEQVASEFRLAARRLRHAPGFTAGALLTFALGAGLNLAGFAIADRMLFRPLPFEHPERLISIFSYSPESGQRFTRVSKPEILALTADTSLITDFAAVDACDLHRVLTDDGATIRVCPATHRILDVLGVRPILGRGFTETDLSSGAPVLLITYEAWQAQLGGDASVLGLTVAGRSRVLDAGGPAAIVGVLPPGFVLPSVNWSAGGDALRLNPVPADRLVTPNDALAGVVARLAPGRAVAEVQRRAAQISRAQAEQSARPASNLIVEGLQAGLFWRYREVAQLLVGAASLIWLLGCANVSMMVAARGRRREADVAISVALGASTARLAGGALAETMMVCVGGAGVALLAVFLGLPAIQAIVPAAVAGVVVNPFEPRVVLAGLSVAVAGAALAGLMPALRVSRTDVLATLQQGGARGSARSSGAGLLVVQSAIAFLLVVAAVAGGRSLVAHLTTDLGFQPRGLYAVFASPVDPSTAPRQDAAERWAQLRASVDRLRSQPWVASASASSAPIISNNGPLSTATDAQGRRYPLNLALDAFARTDGLDLVAGRDFVSADIGAAIPVALISTGVAQALWPDVAPAAVVGRVATFNEAALPVVGVFRDRRRLPTAEVTPEVFVAARPHDRLMATFRLAGRLPAGERLETSLAPLLAPGADVSVAMFDGELIQANAVRDPRLIASAFALFALTAFGLGAVGVATVAGGAAIARRKDLAIRQMLGGTRSQLIWSVVRRVLRPVLAGLAIGTLAALWAGRFLQAHLYLVDAHDPRVLALTWCVFLAVALVITWWPARRVSLINPVDSLKSN